jgi:hypothetical protein
MREYAEALYPFATSLPEIWRGAHPSLDSYSYSATPKDELAQYERQWQRSETLPKWDISIVPI